MSLKFPGSRLLHEWDLSIHQVTYDELVRSCQQVGLTGFAEMRFADAAAMVFYYLGSEVNALFREGPISFAGEEALERLRTQVAATQGGSVAVYEVPLDMAHLLRGLTQRQRRDPPLAGRADLDALVSELERAGHTGVVELQVVGGSGLYLFVAGRVSNVYWETSGGTTLEKDVARRAVERAVQEGPATAFVSSFSREAWKSRQETQGLRPARASAVGHAGSETLAEEEAAWRQEALESLHAAVPALLTGLVVDLLTGAVLARRDRGSASLRAGLLADRLGPLLAQAREALAGEGDELERYEVTAGRATAVAVHVPQAREALVAVAEHGQPVTAVGAALERAAREYGLRLRQRLATGS